MFWNAIKGGLSVLLHWETYVMMLVYVAISFIPTIIISRGLSKARLAGDLGCLGGILLPFQSLGMCIYIITLSPIILGFSDSASFRLPWNMLINAPLQLLILTGLVAAITMSFYFIPIIRKSMSLRQMISGGIVLIFILRRFEAVSVREITRSVDIVPDMLTIIGFVFIVSLCTTLYHLIARFVLVPLHKKLTGESPDFAVMFYGAIINFLPVFIYGAWIGNQINKLIR